MDAPSLHPVDLQVYPPDAGRAHNHPQRSLLSQRAYGQPLQDNKIAQYEGEEDREAEQEEKGMEWQVKS